MKKILLPLPEKDFDPSEASIPWKLLKQVNFQIYFATPQGLPATADPRMLTGKGLGPFKSLLAARADAVSAYQEMTQSSEFQNPLNYEEALHRAGEFDLILLPGGHAPGMRPYLESTHLQMLIATFFDQKKQVAAICHGVLLVARTQLNNVSVIKDYKLTALRQDQEMTAWWLTRWWLGDYYRTYHQSVESEVLTQLSHKKNFLRGPWPLGRDSTEHLEKGFAVQDRNLITARWPGDIYTFSEKIIQALQTNH